MNLPPDAPRVAGVYDRLAGRYDRRWHRYVRCTTEALDRRAAVGAAERALDVGCGTGAFLARLLARHPAQDAAGVDASRGMLAEARRKLAAHPHVRLVHAPAEALPFAADAFDVVVSASAFHFFPDPRAALAEAARVLRSGGRLVLLDWRRDAWRMKALGAVLRYTDRAYVRAYTPAELAAMLRAAGFALASLDRHRCGGWPLMTATAFLNGI